MLYRISDNQYSEIPARRMCYLITLDCFKVVWEIAFSLQYKNHLSAGVYL